MNIGAVIMAAVRKTITLTDQQYAWIAAQIAGGRYANASEAIRDLIRREQERDAQLESLRGAFMEGEHSGEPKALDRADFKLRMMERHG